MSRSKLYFYLVILMLISVITFVAQLESQEVSTEEKRVMVQEFVKKAEEFVKQNQIEEAIEIYERITKTVPEDFESREQLATLYLHTNQHEKAAQTWSKLLEAAPENTKYQDALINSLQAAGKRNEALELAQSYIQTEPEVGVHYARLAKLFADEDNLDAAITNYEKVIELEHADKHTYLKLAKLYFFNEDIDGAEKALKNAILSSISVSDRQSIERQLINFYRYHGNLEEKLQKAEDDGTITLEMQKVLAEYFHIIGELEKSVNAYKRALVMTTSSYEKERISAELLKAYVELGEMNTVIEPYETEANSNTNSKPRSFTSARITVTSARIAAIYKLETARDSLIGTFKSQDKLEMLKTHYEGKLRENKENPVARTILAKIYWDEKDYQKAAEMYEALGKAESNDVRYFYYAAAALKKNKQPELAKEMLKQAKQALASCSEKDDVWFLGALATICIENRMYEPAIELSKSAIDKSDSDTDSRIQDTLREILAKSYRETKRYVEAYDIYQESATRNRAKNAIREIAKEGKLYEKRIPEQLKKVEMNPNDPNLILELAESYEATDKIKQAIEQYQKLTKLQPKNVRWYIKLGDLFQRMDRKVGKVIESNALSLDGDGSFVEIADSEIINNISEQVTISAWIKPADFPNTCTTVLFKGNKRIPNISHRQFTLWLFDEGCVFFDTSPGGRSLRWTASASETIKKNEWYHVAGTIDARNNIMKLYLNGSEVRRNDFKGENNLRKTTLPFRIGCSHEEEQSEHASFAGLIDEVRIWDIARTENQIRSDMNKQLKGDESGLVGYWKFDAETQGRISDSSPNKNDGQLIGNAKLEPYTRPIFGNAKTEHLTKSASYYEKAIELNPKTYLYYDLLAKLYIKQNKTSDAVTVYRRALDAPLSQGNHNSLIRAIYELYADEGQEDKSIAILEDIKPKMEESVVLHKLLGDLYHKTGDSKKAELANAKWLKIRQQGVNKQSENYQRRFADELLDKGLFPETALKYAKRALQGYTGTSFYYPMTLGHACIANELYDDALKYYKYALNILHFESSSDIFWGKVAEASKNSKDKKRYIQMLDALINSIPPRNSSFHANVYGVNVYLNLAEYYSKNNMPDKAMEQMRQTGMIAENAWLTLGPFDNTGGVGFNTEYILEDTTQIDLTGQYEGVNEQISWKKFTDAAFNGFIDLGRDTNQRVSYAWTTVTSPDEREAQFRFGIDDQGKMWLNGKEVFANPKGQSAVVDGNIISVTLKAGKNTILVKVCNEEKFWGFYLRVTDADGKPFEDLQINDVPDN